MGSEVTGFFEFATRFLVLVLYFVAAGFALHGLRRVHLFSNRVILCALLLLSITWIAFYMAVAINFVRFPRDASVLAFHSRIAHFVNAGGLIVVASTTREKERQP